MASGRPAGAGHVIYGDAALQLLDHGYEPIPLKPGQKVPALSRWSSVAIDESTVEGWCVTHGTSGIGLRTGALVAVDIDSLDPDRAHAVQALAIRRFGATLMRVGQWPKRLLLYRTEVPFTKMKVGEVEILGRGQQFVAFGIHPGTQRPYGWPNGETPLEVPLDALPVINREAAAAFLAETGPAEPLRTGPRRCGGGGGSKGTGSPVRDVEGRVIDGRDDWLSRIAFHAVHDALDVGEALDPSRLADRVWSRFTETADLTRPRQDGGAAYDLADALRKVRDKLRLAGQRRLPNRGGDVPEPAFQVPDQSVEAARSALADVVARFCEEVLAWHGGSAAQPPMLGILATVGLGKSHASREQLLALAAVLRARGLPHRMLVFTASHALAEETAAAWTAASASVAVLRGYERKDPATGVPLCKDLEAVRASLAAGLKVRDSACSASDDSRCQHFATCLKQQNLRDVAAADVVVAPYDALFSGLAFERDDVALLLIDEGCWARAIERRQDICVEDLASESVAGMGGDRIGRGPVGAMADLVVWRTRLAAALAANGPGPVSRSALVGAGLSAETCRDAAGLERWRLQDTGLAPGLKGNARQAALSMAVANARILSLASLWQALARFLSASGSHSGQLRIGEPDGTGRHPVHLSRVQELHDSLRGKPILHLDATMRPDLVHTVLPRLDIARIEAAAPHMQVRQVAGSFGKSMLCPAPGLEPDEVARRANRLQECVDYVHWHARRVSPGRVLVVTYQSIEQAFAGIPNVETAHFNAVAGLDRYKDVALLIVIGRPLAPSRELEALVGAYFGHVPEGRYRKDLAGIRMTSGQTRGLVVLRHEDDLAETLRAAICDDELIQVIGRGRGVNRTAQDPLEVHVLADVALPLAIDRLTAWDVERPDVVQRMLLAGIAVDSPADAAALHPELFSDEKQAQKAFERAVFKRQNPMYTSYREMSLKSAAYRRAGRGRSWQRAWWIEGAAEEVRARLQHVLGELAEWRAGCQ
ncbi:bifunctional DNA primase/polymerase [Oceaniglobus roseus]|uniref:bifunctional DNA primase/polymerase n=1 Tax=Oceaniglobus roseus TaxID=1737570 RepID=UPI001FEA18BB|nr:bifunctional DNA primase/polymerase [Kandeliimicrobium roseum]